jgi:hypothetical protein
MIRALCSLLMFAFAAPLMAQIPLKIYAQDLVDRTVAANPDLLVIVMHVTPPKAAENIIIASNIGRIGKPGDQDDLRVIETGKANLEVAANGERFEVELPLLDVNGATIGALGLVWPYRAGQDKAAFAAKADRIRDGLAKRTLNAASLMEPYLLDPRATTRTRAQKLVDAAAARHAEFRLLAIRGQSKTLGGFVLLGSTFGRHGKKAVAEQVAVFQRGEPAGVVHADIKRYSVDVPLLDRAGRKAGLMTVSYPWNSANDEQALMAKALALRDELRAQIASAEQLEELDP